MRTLFDEVDVATFVEREVAGYAQPTRGPSAQGWSVSPARSPLTLVAGRGQKTPQPLNSKKVRKDAFQSDC
jgi:hypothetical protein